MNKLIVIALAGTLAAAPVAVLAQETLLAPLADQILLNDSSDIRVVPVTSVGGSVDGVRAAAVAGGPVEEFQWIGMDSAVIDTLMARHNVAVADIDKIYTDTNGTFWVFVSDDERDESGPSSTPTT